MFGFRNFEEKYEGKEIKYKNGKKIKKYIQT